MTRRLNAPPASEAPVMRPVSFWYDGRRIEGREGEPVAASLLAAGMPVLSRSFRFHRPRGLMCSTGQCGWCECRIDDAPSVRACRASVREGMRVTSEHSWPSARRDLLGMIDIFSGLIPNTFYHHRFLRPRFLRKTYLDVLRAFGGRGRLTAGGGTIRPLAMERIEAQVVVVGGGPSGLLAARGAADGGASVLLIEAEPSLGGAWRWRTAPLPDGTLLAALIESVTAHPRVRVLTSTQMLGDYGGDIAALGEDSCWRVRGETIIAATGSYERVPAVVNNDRPGVIGARTVEWLINSYGIVPGSRPAVLCESDEGRRVAGLLTEVGANVVVLGEREKLLGVGGRDRVRWLTVSEGERTRRVSADLLVFDARTPNLDLALSLGVIVEQPERGRLAAQVDARGGTNIPRFFMVGACAGRPAVDAAAVDAAREIGSAVAATLPSGGQATTDQTNRARTMAADHGGRFDGEPPTAPWPVGGHGTGVGATVDERAFACFCEDVRVRELRAEQVAGHTQPEVLKRRTAALTGPCQGKYCLPAFAAAVDVGHESSARLPTGRPPLRPVALGALAGRDDWDDGLVAGAE